MPDETRLILAFLVGLGAAFAVTPAAIAAATRTGFQDQPVGYKSHRRATPYLGGAAVLGGFLLGLVPVGGRLSHLAPIVLVALGLWALGTLDDRFSLSARSRLLAEAAAATLLWWGGLGWSIFDSELLNLIATNLWVVGLVNAFNLMDNMDGAAATVGAVTAAATSILALLEGDPVLAALCFGLCGACVGFLPYNLTSPARIFLGDGGSLPIGLIIAGAIMALFRDNHSGFPLLLAALILAGLPVVDTALVMVSRRRAGVPLLSGGTDHLTHRLARRLPSARRVALMLGLTQAALGATAIGAVALGRGSIITAWCLWFLVAAGTVFLLETRAWAPERPSRPSRPARSSRASPERSSPAPRPPRPRPETRPSSPRPRVTLVEGGLVLFITAVLGLSPVLYGFYDVSVWGPIALFLLAALLGMLLARPAVPSRPALLALGGLVTLWLWSFLSTLWAESAEQAFTEANRWMLYAALFGILILLLRDDRLGKLMLGSLTVAILGLAAYLTVRLLSSGGPSLFLYGRLNKPFGYVNGEAGYLMLAFWPLIATAERASRLWVSTASISLATLLGGLIVLTETRSMIPAFIVTVIALLAFIPGRRGRVWALLFSVAGVAAVSGPLIDVYRSGAGGELPDGATVQRALILLLLASLATGAAWFATERAADRVAQRVGLRGLAVRSARTLAVLGAVALAAIVPLAVPSVNRVKTEAQAFTKLQQGREPGTRLVSGSGNRYDYWRIAAKEFASAPLQGLGAGNFDRDYYLERRTQENVRQPHSIVLQALSELGLVGGLALAAFVGGVLWGLRRRVLRAGASGSDRVLAVAAGGVFLTWLVHTSVDWVHLIPGVTGVALCAAAVLVGPWDRPSDPSRQIGRRRLALAACGLAVVFGAVMVGRTALADKYRSDARDAVAADPGHALGLTARSLALDPESLPTYYVRAAAWARLDRYPEARVTLLEAARREPHDFVTWTLLGDLAARRGELVQARRAYRHGVRLNPRDTSLRALAKNPATALPR